MSDPKNHEVHYILEGGRRYYFCDAVVNCSIHPAMDIEMIYSSWRANEKQLKLLVPELAAANERVAELIKDNADVASLNGDLVIENRTMREALVSLRNEFAALAKIAEPKPIEASKSAFDKLVAEIDEALKESPDG